MARLILIMLAAFAIESAMSTVKVDSVDNICTLVSTGQLADPSNCKQYYECKDGTATKKSCVGSTVYSKNTMKCVPAADGECDTVTSSNACNNKPIDSFVNNPSDCSAYYYCNSKGVAVSGQCPNGLNFNPTDNTCDYNSVYPCQNGQSSIISGNEVCLYMPSGIYFGDPTSCSDWNYCTSDNSLESGSCDPYVFNLITQSCNYQSQTTCTQILSPPVTGGPCESGDPNKSAGKNAACNIYYKCTNGQYQLQTCPSQQYFDSDALSCSSFTATTSLDCNNCANLNNVFMSAPSSSGCNAYYYCTNGTASPVSTCPDDLYFNQMSGFCTETDPDYGWCTPAAR